MRTWLAAFALVLAAGSAGAAERPADPWQPSCTWSVSLPYALLDMSPTTRYEVTYAHSVLSLYLEDRARYVGCLRAALAATKAAFAKSGRTVDPVVDQSVARLTARSPAETKVIEAVAAVVNAYDKTLPPGSPDVVAQLDPDAPPSNPMTPAAGTGLLSLRPTVAGRRPSCSNPQDAAAPDGEAKVLVGYDVAPDGTFASVRLLQSSGVPQVDTAAIACVATWRDTPPVHDGVPSVWPNQEVAVLFTHLAVAPEPQ